MIDSIILLNNGMMYEKIESDLRAINPNVKVSLIQDLVKLVELPEELLRKSRLIAYLSGLIVPLTVIKKLGYGAYNFHSGPPTRPGFASLEMAIYEGDEIFATTLHELDELIDTGRINGIHAFSIPKDITAPELFKLVLNSMMTLFEKNKLEEIFNCSKGHPPVLKSFLKKEISIETLVIYNRIFSFSKAFDKKLLDPVWETVSLKIKKYDPFLNIDVFRYRKILKEIILEDQ